MSESPKHPFGRENEVSVKKLFRSFCNHLNLGQWEGAKACIKELNDQHELIDLNIFSVLKDVVRNPIGKCHDVSDEIGNPHLLSWLALEEGIKFVNPNEENIERWNHDVEFRLLLVECCNVSGVEAASIQDLYHLYLLLRNKECDDDVFRKCKPTLEQLLIENPILGHSVLQSLQQIVVKQNLKYASQFRELYVVCLTKIQNELVHSDEKSSNCNELKTRFCSLLSKIDDSVIKEEESLESYHTLFNGLLEFIHTKPSLLQIDDIYSCLLGKTENSLLELFQQVEVSWSKNKSRQLSEPSTVLGENDLHFFSIVTQGDRQRAWRELFQFSSAQQRHFLDAVIEVAVKLIRGGEFSRLRQLLDVPEFQPLKSLMLLIGWDQCHDLDSASELVASLWDSTNKREDLLRDACTRLQLKAELLHNYQHQSEKLKSLDSSVFEESIRTKLYSGVKLYSTLQALNKCTRLSDLDQDDVVQFIQAVEDNGSETCKLPKEDSTELFRGYSALKTFTDALMTSANMVHWRPLKSSFSHSDSYSVAYDSVSLNTLTEHTQLQDSTKENLDESGDSKVSWNTRPSLSRPSSRSQDSTRLHRSYSVATSTHSTADIEDIQSRYHDQVSRLLELVKDNVLAIQCVQFRIELLEDLFSLLFLRAEDILDPGDQAESEEERPELSLVLNTREQGAGVETPICQTPGTPTSPPFFLSPLKPEMHHSAMETLLENKPKVNRNLFRRKKDGSGEKIFNQHTDTTRNEAMGSAKSSDREAKRNIETQRSLYDQLSASSYTSISGLKDKHGFLCNEYFMRDALLLLKMCLDSTEPLIHSSNTKGHNVKIQTPQQENIKVEPTSTDVLKSLQCSIETKDCKKRSVTLMQHISEALWCFQLVSHDCIPFQYGKILTNPRHLDFSSSDDEIVAPVQPEITVERLSGGLMITWEALPMFRGCDTAFDFSSEDEAETTSRKARRKRKSGTDSGQLSDSQATDGSQRSSSPRRRKRHHHRRGKRAHVRSVLTRHEGIVSGMLADKDTLLAMCLRRGKLAQAAQVVKLFSLEDSRQEAEVVFAEHFQAALSKIRAHDAESATKPTSRPASEGRKGGLAALGKGALANIAKTAARGLASVSITSTVDQLLSMSIQPSLLPSSDVSDNTLLDTINNKLVPSMVVLDLACSGSNTLESSNNLLDQARKRLPADVKKNIEDQTTDRDKYKDGATDVWNRISSLPLALGGIVGFIQNSAVLLSQLTNYQKPSTIPSSRDTQFENKKRLAMTVTGLNSILSQGVLSLDPDVLRKTIAFDDELKSLLNKTQAALLEHGKHQKMRLHKKKGSKSKPPALRFALKNQVSFLEKTENQHGLIQYIARHDSDLTTEALGYATVFYKYFKTLSFLQAETDGITKEAASQLEYFDNIYSSATTTLGRLLFTRDKDPTKLEKIVSELGIELVDVILHNCCPSLPLHSSHDASTTNELGQVVLNELVPHDDSPIPSMQCLQTVLVQWIHAFKVFIASRHASPKVTMDDCEAFTHTSSYGRLAALTTRLRNMRHFRSDDDAQKLCWQLNLLQLLTLHALCHIVQTSAENVGNFLKALKSADSDSLMLQKYCYNIGNIGVISLQDVIDQYGGFIKGTTAAYSIGEKDPWKLFEVQSMEEYRLQVCTKIGFGRKPEQCFQLQALYPDMVQHHHKRSADSAISRGQTYGADHDDLGLIITFEKSKHTHTTDTMPSTVSSAKKPSPYIKTPEYTLTYNTEVFIRHQSDILATLATLLNVTLSGGENEISKIQKPCEKTFPVLWRHISISVLPLCLERNLLNTCDTQTVPEVFSQQETPECVQYLLSPNTAIFKHVLAKLILGLLHHQEWNKLSVVLLQSAVLRTYHAPEIVHLKDRAIEILAKNYVKQHQMIIEPNHASDKDDAKEEKKSKMDSTLMWSLVMSITNWDVKSRVLLHCLELWDIVTCVRHLQEHLRVMPREHLLRAAVDEKLETLQVYQQICQLAQTQLDIGPLIELHYGSSINQFSLDELDDHNEAMEDVAMNMKNNTIATLNEIKEWQKLVKISDKTPDMVLEFLLKMNEHELTRKWIQIHGLVEFNQLVDEAHVLSLLEKSSPRSVISAMTVLEKCRIQNETDCKVICYNVMNQFQNKENVILIAKFLLHSLAGVLSESEIQWLLKVCIGCKALAHLPLSLRADYHSLIVEPLLLLEQLLMNMRIDIASKVLRCIKCEIVKHQPSQPCTPTNQDDSPFTQADTSTIDDLATPTNAPTFPSFPKTPSDRIFSSVDLGIELKECDELLVKYAEKALEFPVVQPEAPMSGRLSMVSSRSLGSMSSLHVRRTSAMPVATVSPSPNRFPKVSSFSQLSQRQMVSPPPHTYSNSMSTKQSPKFTIGSPEGRAAGAGNGQSGFVMPAEAPARQDWVPDSAANVCMCCKVERFSMFNRRHHCRRCGRVVCSECSAKTLSVRGSSARACDDCYLQSFKPKQASLPQDRVERMRQTLSGALGSPKPSPGTSPSIAGSRAPSSAQLDTVGVGLSDAGGAEYQYLLSLDDDLNEETREEFYYDHAPSASLCLSLLDLHSSPVNSANILLDMCDHVSKYLQPIAPGIKNPEVDYGLIVSMMKNLLFSAKMKFHKVQEGSGITKCDLYLDRVKIIDLLVATNVSYIPSVQQLTRMDVLRRLRDKLIQSEHWELAKDISTKCGIDPAGVWMAWGKVMIKYGDFGVAREKFAKCLKPPIDKNQSHSATKPLSDILEVLETSAVSTDLSAGLLLQLKSVKDLLAEPQKPGYEDILDSAAMQECLYYLHTYGTHGNLVNFYQKHGLYIKALGLIYSEKCSSEIFIENLWLPAVQSGEAEKLQQAMLTLDSSLDRWSAHLNALCRHLHKAKMMHLLYRTQLFMKDYIRAAMTCVTHFYQRDAASYRDLYERLSHLTEARRHMESYLDGRLWADDPSTSLHPGTPQPDRVQRLIMTPREISKYIHTTELQVEVTKYLHQYLENLKSIQSVSRAGPSSAARGQSSPARQTVTETELPTLFGSTRMKAQVACLIILSGNHINDGFGLAFRIIQDFKLDSGTIYSQVGTTLARIQRYSFIRQLLSCMKDSGLCTDHNFDDVISPCVDIMARDDSQSKELEEFIKMMRSDVNKINAYMQCGRLKSAYLIAVKTQRVEVVQAIAAKAEVLGQSAVKHICDKWLRQRQQSK